MAIGDYPFCPHDNVQGCLQMGEEPMEAYVDDNITSDPNGVLITTRGERRKLMAQHNLEYRKKAPKPGGRLFFDMKGR